MMRFNRSCWAKFLASNTFAKGRADGVEDLRQGIDLEAQLAQGGILLLHLFDEVCNLSGDILAEAVKRRRQTHDRGQFHRSPGTVFLVKISGFEGVKRRRGVRTRL